MCEYKSKHTHLQEPLHSIGWESEKGGEEVALLLLAHSTHTDMNMIQKNKAADAFDGNNGGRFVQGINDLSFHA